MPKIDITSLDTYEDNEESFEKMRSRKPKQQREVRSEKKHHREKKVEIWDLPEEED